jgi:hypothetical protein
LTTEIVYIVNSQYLPLLRLSVDSLLRSGSRFDSVKIFLTDAGRPGWRADDPRVHFVEWEDVRAGEFLLNKTCMTDSEAERLIFLDADTLVLGRLETVYEGSGKDFLARIANPYLRGNWNTDAWRAACARLGAKPVPYFNSGFVVFQNASHKRLAKVWPDIIRGGLDRTIFDASVLHTNPAYHEQRYLEQLSLSLAVAASALSWEEMAPSHHAWAWNQEPHAGAVVFHTAGPKFFMHAERIYRERGLAGVFDQALD